MIKTKTNIFKSLQTNIQDCLPQRLQNKNINILGIKTFF